MLPKRPLGFAAATGYQSRSGGAQQGATTGGAWKFDVLIVGGRLFLDHSLSANWTPAGISWLMVSEMTPSGRRWKAARCAGFRSGQLAQSKYSISLRAGSRCSGEQGEIPGTIPKPPRILPVPQEILPRACRPHPSRTRRAVSTISDQQRHPFWKAASNFAPGIVSGRHRFPAKNERQF